MGAVGLLYVGAVLAINGLMLLGLVEAKSAAPLNLFVGGLQVVTPTVLIIQSGGDPNVILGASGIYLFGFTYLYVGINLLAGLDGTGLGWFSAFVACCAVVYAGLNFGRFDDPAFGVIWLVWAVLWALFWVVLGLGRESLSRFTGAVALVAGILTAAIPAFLILIGEWVEYTTTWAIVIAVATVVILGALFPRLRGPAPAARANVAAEPGVPATSTGVPEPRSRTGTVAPESTATSPPER
ncbi:MAG: AmiS/UreI family transporter [Blastococcus sp.]